MLIILYSSNFFCKIFNIDYIIEILHKIINVRNMCANVIEEINIGLIDILNTYGGFTR
jgi:hypothetical protein